VLSELLGIPMADREWISAAVIDYGQAEESERVTRELAAYFTGLIAAKRAEPGSDLLIPPLGCLT
jgi:cytochrome P450